MPRIGLSEAFGLNVDGALAQGASLRSILPQFAGLRDLTLDQTPVSEASLGLEFGQPIQLTGQTALTVGASGAGRLALLRGRQKPLDENDPFGAIIIGDDEIYMALGLDFSFSGGAGGSSGPVAFGFDRAESFVMKSYRRFTKDATGFPTFAKAFGTALDSFLLPKNAGDLQEVQADTVLVIAGSGTLTVNGGFSITTPVQSLASVALAGDTGLEVKAGGAFAVDAAVTLTGGYQIRLRRSGPRTVELGVYNLASSEKALSVSASAGVAARVGGFDLAERLIGALSRQPLVDAEEFKKALPDEDELTRDRRIAAFDKSLRSAVSTKLEASIKATFSRLRSDEAAWLFEIDLDAATSEAARGAIDTALAGDFSALTMEPTRLPAGVTQLENVLTRSAVRSQTLRVNLLGILNFLSVANVAQVSRVEVNERGEITLISDTASSNRLRALLQNVGGDRRLRKMLSENFLVEGAYQVANLKVLPPEFQARHTYFEVRDSTNRAAMKDNLDIARVLGLITPAAQQERLGDRRQFGRTTFYAELRYSDEALRRVFFNDRQEPRSAIEYEDFGRSALGALIAGDDGQELRRLYADLTLAATDFWNNMKRQGPFNFGPLFNLPKDSNDPRLGVAIADFIAITDWAKAMRAAAVALREVRSMLEGAGAAPDDAVFTAAREHLNDRLADAVSETHDQFGDPLGMLMVYLASNQDADKVVRATGDQIETLAASSAEGRVTHA